VDAVVADERQIAIERGVEIHQRHGARGRQRCQLTVHFRDPLRAVGASALRLLGRECCQKHTHAARRRRIDHAAHHLNHVVDGVLTVVGQIVDALEQQDDLWSVRDQHLIEAAQRVGLRRAWRGSTRDFLTAAAFVDDRRLLVRVARVQHVLQLDRVRRLREHEARRRKRRQLAFGQAVTERNKARHGQLRCRRHRCDDHLEGARCRLRGRICCGAGHRRLADDEGSAGSRRAAQAEWRLTAARNGRRVVHDDGSRLVGLRVDRGGARHAQRLRRRPAGVAAAARQEKHEDGSERLHGVNDSTAPSRCPRGRGILHGTRPCHRRPV